ncbi:N-acetylmuramoyl-L-alanine amidase [Maledivibacter halophilus]|uniref:N-acetylmuramoyl-L-alanine amidase n=1 Tax=Maledivibacter halophilus TaxID=36842 RepID=A0A1T5K1N1_9FIRM|nr:N-acetylmuramoyl-L-alanine amidase [Maledivibacter halophilus]SKC57450.1 N-acetylmuramoyl-L-alanine amidase [Maledivibacter halophilus]
MNRICLDYGHGGSDPGAVYKARCEKDDVLRIGLAVASEVRRHGVLVDETRTTDSTLSLKNRSDMENKKTYDYFISIHRNAFKPEAAQGVETFTYINQTEKAKSLADKIQKELVAIGLRNRGIKKANFHVLRETKAPAVLVEIGFIDNTQDNKLFDNKFNEIVEGITKAILLQLGVVYKGLTQSPPASNNQTLYRVMAGSYSIRENAENQVAKLKKSGFDATIMIFKP